MDAFLAKLAYSTVIAPRTPNAAIDDPKDAPILNAAVSNGIECLISGDRHFLSLKTESLRIVSPSGYLESVAQAGTTAP
jgi:predicted nucleic acid-binding protein